MKIRETEQDSVSDPAKVAEAGKREKNARESFLCDVKSLLMAPQGQRFFRWLLTQCLAEVSIWHPSAQIHYNSGVHDVGLKIKRLLKAADPELLAKIMVDLVPDEGERK